MNWLRPLSPATQLLLIVLVLGLVATLLNAWLQRRHGRDREWPVSRIFKRAVVGAPDLLAIGVAGTVLLLVVTGTAVPDLLANSFLVVLGYYFGRARGTAGASLESR